MRILRIKHFAIPGQVQPQQAIQGQPSSAKNILIEQMRTEREVMKTQRQKMDIATRDRQNKIKNVLKQQAEDRKEKQDMMRGRAQALKKEMDSSTPDNTYLYKNKSIPTPPVPMK